MGSVHFLPFEKIPKFSRICLYGAGLIGRRYYEQNNLLKWCDITLVVDGNYKNILDFPTSVFAPDSIVNKKSEFDYVLVAVHEKNSKKSILNFLHDVGVGDESIIDSTEEFLFKDACNQIVELEKDNNVQKVRLAWCISRAMGDQVISLKPYQALLEVCQCVETDVYCNGSSTAESIYFDQKGIRRIKKESEPDDYTDYDLILEVGFLLILKAVRYNTLIEVCPELCKKIRNLQAYQEDKSSDTGVYPYTSRIIMDRAKFLGKNRYTMLAEPGLFDYEDKKVQIFIDKNYEDRYKELRIEGKYITFNCEAGPAPGTGLKQIKEWPRKNYVELVELFKNRFPEIKTVQIGGCDAEPIAGADATVFGESLEVVKYVLKKSILHIDCESGLPHLATQLGTKCCVLFGPTPIWFLAYENNINIKAGLCHGCKGLISNWYSECFKYERPMCMESITPEMVFCSIESYLKQNGDL